MGKIVRIICPNCGKRLAAIENEKCEAKYRCDRCGICIFSKEMKCKIVLEIPKAQ